MNGNMLSFDEAQARLLSFVRPVREIETVDTMMAAGRVLAVALHSTIDQPPMDNSAMDGYALRVADVPAAGTRLPISQRIPAGSVGHALQPGTAARIFTGAPLPAGADAVVMQELCEHDGEHVVVNTVPPVGEAVRRMGQDIAAGAQVLPAGLRLTPQALALAASVGAAQLPVYRRLKVALFSTGSELVMPGEPLPPGGIYNSNRFMLRNLLAGLGCEVEDFGIVPDRLDLTREALRRAAEGHDLILSSGGVSVGEEDHVKPAVEAEGSLDLWKIAMKPGKPLAYGRVHGAAFIGLPGNPVSSFVTFLLMVRPFLLAAQGVREVLPQSLMLRADFDWPRPDRRREFLRARMNGQGGIELFVNQASSAINSTVWANGLVDIPADTVVARGETVRFLPYGDLLN
ncbi:molybdopterin molybdotransferase MoeA [Thauera linaloolentis]|uniref:Molybdopterin molybdenumtransferase n=1 Tax=Thauera linaloolentis (strain DSM 12138 / JCM 21573 / CCUG 41526 / CIP 105981 / IAM 15112 / NBRC 102519 / 47Lol) TaxID=1123367 RepID=N6YSD7_THAL4|nr:gephyrin-like molybdotransferase Glp [Thauera linaloolentis]ENO85118.1 molybdenum cofactor synthesis protein [Thauera linaloolentis 47Lol = DSM 12138]MCM8565877.1 molybdopterin molybdotransferase MoeA [Thauera linaloolentis]